MTLLCYYQILPPRFGIRFSLDKNITKIISPKTRVYVSTQDLLYFSVDVSSIVAEKRSGDNRTDRSKLKNTE